MYVFDSETERFLKRLSSPRSPRRACHEENVSKGRILVEDCV